MIKTSGDTPLNVASRFSFPFLLFNFLMYFDGLNILLLRITTYEISVFYIKTLQKTGMF